jgi:hypothetical protein
VQRPPPPRWSLGSGFEPSLAAPRGGSHGPLIGRRSALGACLLGGLACAAPSVQMGLGPREYVADDYDSVLRRWTRTESLISLSALDNFLTATATYESWDFRWAYAVRYAEDYRLTVDQRHALLERSLAETEQYHQFYVALYAQKLRWADLSSPNPAWIVRLIDDQGNETAPSEIERIRKPSAIELTYFPYTTPWRTTHRIRFPVLTLDGRRTISDRANWLGLRFAGAQGNQRLLWMVEG